MNNKMTVERIENVAFAMTKHYIDYMIDNRFLYKALEEATKKEGDNWGDALEMLFTWMKEHGWSAEGREPANQLFKHAIDKFERFKQSGWGDYGPSVSGGYKDRDTYWSEWAHLQLMFLKNIYGDADYQAMLDRFEDGIYVEGMTDEEYTRKHWPNSYTGEEEEEEEWEELKDDSDEIFNKYYPDDMEGQPYHEKLNLHRK